MTRITLDLDKLTPEEKSTFDALVQKMVSEEPRMDCSQEENIVRWFAGRTRVDRRVSDRAERVMELAKQEALARDHAYVGTEHILFGILKEGTGIGVHVLMSLGVDLEKMTKEIEKHIGKAPRSHAVPAEMGPFATTPMARRVLAFGIMEAQSLCHQYLGTEHLLLGMLREEECVAADILTHFGVKVENARQEILKLLNQTTKQ